jgi:broad specificity phosphatase PhoE
MTTLLLARHGETSWNRDGRFQGHADPPLSDAGREQARALAAELADAPLAAVYASDLRRAAETAEIVAERHGLSVRTDPALREVDVGEWSGLTWDEIRERYPLGAERHNVRGHGWEDGESHEQMAERVLATLRKIAADHDGRQVLVVIHGGSMRAIAAHMDGVAIVEHRRRSTPARNCELRMVAVENGAFRRIE